MSDNNQSTDRTIFDTSNETPRVLARGSVQLLTTDYENIGSAYYAQAQVDLNFLQKEVVNPEISVWRFTDSGSPTYSRALVKLPRFTRSQVDGSITGDENYYMFWDFESELQLLIDSFSIAAPSVDRTYYWIVYSTSIVKENILPSSS